MPGRDVCRAKKGRNPVTPQDKSGQESEGYGVTTFPGMWLEETAETALSWRVSGPRKSYQEKLRPKVNFSLSRSINPWAGA